MKPLSRRCFLGAAAAAPLVLPAAARGANDRIAMGCIGVGGRGTGVMQGFLGSRELQVVAVCDVQRSRRERAKQIAESRSARGAKGEYQGCQATGDFREVLARDDIDAVLLAPQDHWHGVMAVAAAQRGKDIYCEKPLGVAVRECQAIRDAVRAYARVLQTGTQQRSDRKFRHACELARNGYLGAVHTVEVAAPGPSYRRRYRGPDTPEPVPADLDFEMYVGPAPMRHYNRGLLDWPGWYLIWDYCAGFITNWGVHHLDIALWGCPRLAAQPFELASKTTYRDDGPSDNVNAWQAEFRYPDGLRMAFTDTGHPLPQGCRFVGEEGWVHVNRGGIRAQPASLLGVQLQAHEVHLHESGHHQGDFLRSVRSRRQPVSPVEAGHRASYFGMIAEIAGRLGRTLRWDPAAERFVGDEEANRLLCRPMRSPWALGA
jgi:predicted dehydrogenase